MSKILIETQYLPTIAFFAFDLVSRQMIIDRHENYHKGSYRNRSEILSSQGRLTLSVPLKSGKNSQTPITKVEIDNSDSWQINHLRAIRSCYGKSPFFEYYYHHIEETLSQRYDHLFELNFAIIEKCRSILNLEGSLDFSSQFHLKNDTDLLVMRDFISPKKKYRDQLSTLLDFHPYEQVYSDELPFEPNLSILDLIFCQGPEARLYLRSIPIKK